MEAITRTDKYLAALAGLGEAPEEPITRTEHYYAYMLGQVDKYPEPITRQDRYLVEIIKNGGAGGTTAPLGKLMYKFGVLSDIHIINDARKAKFKSAIAQLESHGAEMICISGDVGINSVESELQGYKQILDEDANIPVYTCQGNHDSIHTAEMWESYTGCPKNFDFVHNGDAFIFLSFDKQTSTSANGATPYTEALEFLRERIERYKGARIFVFIHYPLSGYAGLRTGSYYGFTSASTQDDEMLSLMNFCENVVMFNGHTHFEFDAEAKYSNMNIYRFEQSDSALVHVPSTGYPRNASNVADENKSQGYMVEVYEKAIKIYGIDFMTQEALEEYEYYIAVRGNANVTKNVLYLESNELTIKCGEEKTVSIGLDKPANVTVHISTDNGYVTVSPDTLTFTEDGERLQPVTLTAPSSMPDVPSSLITVSADDFVSKTISVEIVSDNEIIITGDSANLKAGESATFNVNLKNPADVTVNIISDISGVTVSPSELIFTANDNTPKAVTVTAPESINYNVYGSLIITSDGMDSKTYPVTLEVTLPEGYTPIKAIKGIMLSNNIYFDTGLTWKENSRIETSIVKGNSNGSNNMCYYFGVRSESTYAIELGYPNNVDRLDSRIGKVEIKYTGNTSGQLDIVMEHGKFVVNETVLTGSQPFIATENTIYIGASNKNGAPYHGNDGEFMYYRQYDGDELVANYVPCINSEGKVGMYDLVTNTFKSSEGSEEFTAVQDGI